MRSESSIENVFAEALAQADSRDIAAFFNRFVDCLEHCCRTAKGGSVSMMQLYIAEALTKQASQFFGEVVRTFDYCQESERVEKLKGDLLRKEIRELEQRRDELAAIQ